MRITVAHCQLGTSIVWGTRPLRALHGTRSHRSHRSPASYMSSDVVSLCKETQTRGNKRLSETTAAGAKRVCTVYPVLDGRSCRFCGCKDTDEDPVDKAVGVRHEDGSAVGYAWYLGKPRHQEKNEGNVCYYCYALFGARYKHRQITMQDLLAEIGQDLCLVSFVFSSFVYSRVVAASTPLESHTHTHTHGVGERDCVWVSSDGEYRGVCVSHTRTPSR